MLYGLASFYSFMVLLTAKLSGNSNSSTLPLSTSSTFPAVYSRCLNASCLSYPFRSHSTHLCPGCISTRRRCSSRLCGILFQVLESFWPSDVIKEESLGGDARSVRLHVYSLNKNNAVTAMFGMGIYHTGNSVRCKAFFTTASTSSNQIHISRILL